MSNSTSVLGNGSLELRLSASNGWAVKRALQGDAKSQAGLLNGVVSKSIPRIFGYGGKYKWPLTATVLEKVADAADVIGITGIDGTCSTVTFSGPVQSSSGRATTAKLFVQYAMSNSAEEGGAGAGVVLWRTWVTGLEGEVNLEYIDMLEGGLKVVGGSHVASKSARNRSVYVNGWQSWTFAGALRVGEKQPEPYVTYMNAAFHNKVTGGKMGKLNKDIGFRSDMFTCVSEHPNLPSTKESGTSSPSPRSGVLVGWLSQRENFGVVRLDALGGTQRISMVAECDDQIITGSQTSQDTAIVPSVQDAADETPLVSERNFMSDALDPTWKSPKDVLGADFCTDWAMMCIMQHSSTERVGLEDYFSAVGRFNGARSRESSTSFGEKHEIPVGWCSWYHFYEKISQEKLLGNASMLLESGEKPKKKNTVPLSESFPINLFLVDDGYTRPGTWGDWTNEGVDEKRFPKGMKFIADSVRESGATPGLWMAPFAADKNSVVYKSHPEWPLRLKPYVDGKANSSKACNSGFPAKFFKGLDATNQEVLEHVTKSITTAVKEWGFQFIKLDFLYACILRDYSGKRSANNRTNPHMNRAQAFNQGLRTIRTAAGDETYILGCGCPLGPAVGWADAMRVSADAGPSWYPKVLKSDKNNFPCGRNMVRNSLARIGMHSRWWVNDPDCLILRDATQLTTNEVQGIASCVALTGGVALISDDLVTVSEERITIGQVLIPVTGKAAVARDVLYRETPELLVLECGKTEGDQLTKYSGALDNWKVVGVGNWGMDKPRDHMIDRSNVFDKEPCSEPLDIFEFWSQRYQRLERADQSFRTQVAPHACKLFAVRRDSHKLSRCSYVGSDIHFTSGIEVSSWEDSCVVTTSTEEESAENSDSQRSKSELRIGFALPRKVVRGHVWVRIPTTWSKTPRVSSDTAVVPELIQNVNDVASVWKVQCSISTPSDNGIFVGELVISW